MVHHTIRYLRPSPVAMSSLTLGRLPKSLQLSLGPNTQSPHSWKAGQQHASLVTSTLSTCSSRPPVPTRAAISRSGVV